MIKAGICFVLLTFSVHAPFAQGGGTPQYLDSLKHELAKAKDDTSRVLTIAALCDGYFPSNFDTIIFYGKRGLELSQQIKFPRGEAKILGAIGQALQIPGDFPKALEYGYRGLKIAEENRYSYEIAYCLNVIASTYWFLPDYPKALAGYKKAANIVEGIKNVPGARDLKIILYLNIGQIYNEMNQLDTAYYYLQEYYTATLDSYVWHPVALYNLGDCVFKKGDHQKAIGYLHESIRLTEKSSDHFTQAEACATMAKFFVELKQSDSIIYYARKGLATAQSIAYNRGIMMNSKFLADETEATSIKEALYYRKIYDSANDVLFGTKKVQELQKTLAEEQQRQRETEISLAERAYRLKQYAFLGGLGMLFLIAFGLYRNNQQKQKANAVLQGTLNNLKSTQAQLVQSEKMASLGELTAGIAHEIQNPLNFVNNFSDVNRELIDEMKTEIDKGNLEVVKAIATDIGDNEEKINHHGKRADAIVKGMLQHSRTSTQEKEPTDINSLADEYLRLAYHGLRAKDKNFNTALHSEFDQSIGKINIVPQDMGRVLLNLYNNAFYAVYEKSRQGIASFEPLVSVTTKKIGNKIEIRVIDNGMGVPDKVKGKIFQPFFTTKPTGTGTGLGLSLSYDIVKAHGGELTVETMDGFGSEFVIRLPANGV